MTLTSEVEKKPKIKSKKRIIPEEDATESENTVSKRTLKKKRSSTKESTVNTVQTKVQVALKKKKTKNITKAVDTQIVKKSKKRKINTEENQDLNTTNSKDLSREHILQCITAIFHLTQEQLKEKNALFEGESQPVFMQVTCIRVPKTPRRQMRIVLPHSMVSPDDDVALFVCDLQRGRRKDYEPTIEHYQELLNKHKCTSVKTIIPMNQVKTEYDQYELKRKLVSSYDYFLVDGRIAGHLTHLLGKEFFKRRKLPTPIRMQSKDLKHEIKYALRKTYMQLHSFGDTHLVQIGHTSMSKKKILENILAMCEALSKNYPGGWSNIRSIRIKTATSLALPIYMTLKNKNDIEVPLVTPRRPKAYREVTGELSTAYRKTKVTVTPGGDVIVNKDPKNESENENENEEDN